MLRYIVRTWLKHELQEVNSLDFIAIFCWLLFLSDEVLFWLKNGVPDGFRGRDYAHSMRNCQIKLSDFRDLETYGGREQPQNRVLMI